MSILHNLTNTFYPDSTEDLDREYYYQEEYDYPGTEEVVEPVKSTIQTTKKEEIIFCQPIHFDEIVEIIQQFTQGKSILINLDTLDQETGQRAIDFICGSTLTLQGEQTRIAEKVFLFTNLKVNVTKKLEEYTTQNSIMQIA